MIDSIFLDLDGTLTDPMIGITNSVMYALRRFSIEERDRTKLYPFIGPPLVESFMKYYGFSEEKARLALSVYREYFAEKGIFENTVYPGCEDFLRRMKEKGKRLILASSKPEEYVKRILKHFSLDSYFTFIGGSDMEEIRVQKPEIIAYCVENTGGVDPGKCVMVGDRKHDILGAKANWMKSVGVLFGYGSEKELKEAGADRLASNFEELEKIIDEL